MATHQELTLSTFIPIPIPPVPSLHQYCSDKLCAFPLHLTAVGHDGASEQFSNLGF